MQMPLQIIFEHIGRSDALEAAVRKEAQRLDRFSDCITSARVVIARPQHRHHKGDTYCVRIHIAVSGGKHVDITRDEVRKLDSVVKAHEAPPHGVIASLVPEWDHGFIAASDGREIYFHRKSVDGGKLDDLEVGQEVRCSETAAGGKGPQATSVRPVGKPHLA